jgi:hypothetical protein
MSDKELVERLLDFDRVTVGDARDAALRIEALERGAKAHEKEIAVWSENYAAMERKLEAARADTKKAVEGLRAVDALDPEGMIDGCSQPALRGLVLRMGHIARTALAEIEGEKT